ncbi:hypothetical protein IscW_ISCW003903 [Ixodes scapularis]|uniref:Uncharacterized protein n=1 Tax=Ixodes scapularis TaxID=6945 RepID=B7PFC7_IXOSC|nr:hypothetical protein IscW_ISCW003903 [Ixodes scapularis]|eukprot:XP_002433899.1 hypothetical protein IscW_ISCW003903 [Ixodes scapularis]
MGAARIDGLAFEEGGAGGPSGGGAPTAVALASQGTGWAPDAVGWDGLVPCHKIDPPRHNVDVAARDRAAARLRLMAKTVGPAAAQTGDLE